MLLLIKFFFAPLQSQTGEEELKNGRKRKFVLGLGSKHFRLFCFLSLYVENIFRSLQTQKRGMRSGKDLGGIKAFPYMENQPGKKTKISPCVSENFTYLCQPKANGLREKNQNQAGMSASTGIRFAAPSGSSGVGSAAKFFEKLFKTITKTNIKTGPVPCPPCGGVAAGPGYPGRKH